jgi:hypothetical protein
MQQIPNQSVSVSALSCQSTGMSKFKSTRSTFTKFTAKGSNYWLWSRVDDKNREDILMQKEIPMFNSAIFSQKACFVKS